MTSQTVLFNKLPDHLRSRAKRQARRKKFKNLKDAVQDLIERDPVEGSEFWQLVLSKIDIGEVKKLSDSEQVVLQVLTDWPNETFGYRRLIQRTGLSNPELKKIMRRLRALAYIKKVNKKYIVLK